MNIHLHKLYLNPNSQHSDPRLPVPCMLGSNVSRLIHSFCKCTSIPDHPKLWQMWSHHDSQPSIWMMDLRESQRNQKLQFQSLKTCRTSSHAPGGTEGPPNQDESSNTRGGPNGSSILKTNRKNLLRLLPHCDLPRR